MASDGVFGRIRPEDQCRLAGHYVVDGDALACLAEEDKPQSEILPFFLGELCGVADGPGEHHLDATEKVAALRDYEGHVVQISHRSCGQPCPLLGPPQFL